MVSEEEYKEFAQNKDSLQKLGPGNDRGPRKHRAFCFAARDPYYWVKFVQRILELLTDLCIGRKLACFRSELAPCNDTATDYTGQALTAAPSTKSRTKHERVHLSGCSYSLPCDRISLPGS